MSEDISSIARLVERLRDLNVEIRRQMEIAEAQIPQINDALNRLEPLRIYPCNVFMGRIIHTQPYAEDGFDDSCLVVVATVVYGQGFGATFWDSEEFAEFRERVVQARGDVLLRFVPFDELEPGMKALLLPHVGGLLARICNEVIPRHLYDPSARPDVS